MKHTLLCIIGLLCLVACKNESVPEAVDAKLPESIVTEDQEHITQEYVDSLTRVRQQNLVDLRRDLGFNCVKLLDDKKNVSLKIKVYQDGSYDNVEVLDQKDVDIEAIRDCIMKYFEERELNLGNILDLPSSGKTSAKHPHVYTLLIY